MIVHLRGLQNQENQQKMKLSFYGHACFGVEVNGKHLLFDPYITPNELAKDVDVESIPCDYLLISHGHQDHVADAVSVAKRTGAKVVSNVEIIGWFANQGIENGHPLNHGGSWEFDFGRVKYVNAVHSSALPDGSNGGNPGGFVISSSEGNFYFAGDTGLTLDMQLIPRFTKLDFALLPIGDNFTMGMDEAVEAAKMIECDKIVAMHYDTFGYIEVNHEEVDKKFSEAKKELIWFEINETKDI